MDSQALVLINKRLQCLIFTTIIGSIDLAGSLQRMGADRSDIMSIPRRTIAARHLRLNSKHRRLSIHDY